VVVKFMTLDL